ncbi:redoxin domain-containing protein [Cohnella ginsengisoli]|uniref:redoxin domain-containing protein n=1 Tax=Cohnella ginsengisoli TaxID=425004 RepID=UPI0024070A5B|nr:redoxin domain-containing protein [Cohnella ginsengisoli]
MKNKLTILGALLVLFAVALYISGSYGEDDGYAQVRQERQTFLDGQGNERLTEKQLTEERQLEAAPDFTLKDLDGNAVSLRDLRGKAVYLNFWTTWCKWCKKRNARHEAYLPVVRRRGSGDRCRRYG